MTYHNNFTLPTELLEQISSEGLAQSAAWDLPIPVS
jgi:hypothetical protein